MSKTLMSVAVAFVAIVLLTTTPTESARAQGTPPTAGQLFAVPGADADAPIQWLQNIFLGGMTGAPATATEHFLDDVGAEDNNQTGAIQTGLRQILSWYSYAMLVLGSFLLLYYLVRIIAETAHTGRPGGRANQLWGPIRTVLAIGLLVPLASGLNSGQMIIINLAGEGSALATNVWTQFSTAFFDKALIQSQVPVGDSVINNLFLALVCQNAYNSQIGNGTTYTVNDFVTTRIVSEANPVTGSAIPQTMSFGTQNNPNLCGAIHYQIAPTAASGDDTSIIGPAVAAQIKAINDAINNLQPLACEFVGWLAYEGNGEGSGWVGCPPPPLGTTVPPVTQAMIYTNAIVPFQTDMLAAATAAYGGASSELAAELAASNATLGWLAAGEVFPMLGRLQSLIATSSQFLPTIDPPETKVLRKGADGGMMEEAYNAYEHVASLATTPSFAGGPPAANSSAAMAVAKAQDTALVDMTATSAVAAAAGTLPTTSAGASALAKTVFQGTGSDESGVGAAWWVVDKILGKITGAAAGGIFNGQILYGNPIAALQNIGWQCIYAAMVLWAAGIGTGVALAGFSAGPGLSSLLIMLGTVFITPGIMLAFMLPLLPFIRFLFSVFGWLLAFAEAVISIPVFALAHLDPEGEGVLPQQVRQGYLLLLQLLFRPILIIIGLVLALLLMNGMFDFLNLVWAGTVLGVNNNGTTLVPIVGSTTAAGSSSVGVFSNVIFGIIYAGLAYSICNGCFKAMDYVPNQVLRWIGGGGDQHDSGIYHSHATAAVAGTVGAAQGLGQSVGSMSQGMRQAKLTKAAEQVAADQRQVAADQRMDDIARQERQITAMERMGGGQDGGRQAAISAAISDGSTSAAGSEANSSGGPGASNQKSLIKDPTDFIT